MFSIVSSNNIIIIIIFLFSFDNSHVHSDSFKQCYAYTISRVFPILVLNQARLDELD